MQGKVKSTMNYLSQNSSGGVLRLEDMVLIISSDGATDSQCSVHDILKDKHPPGSHLKRKPSCNMHLIQYCLRICNIRQAAMQANGAAGLSGLNAYAWRRLRSSFGSTSKDLCWALAMAGRRLCSTFVHPDSVSAFVACRLIPLNKCPGVRPIRVGEVPRCIIGKAVLKIVGEDIEDALQVCAGQLGGCWRM